MKEREAVSCKQAMAAIVVGKPAWNGEAEYPYRFDPLFGIYLDAPNNRVPAALSFSSGPWYLDGP